MEEEPDPALVPSIHDLFVFYDGVYFQSSLSERCFVEWSSSRMTSCGGTCQCVPGGAVIIRLSKPLLSLRPFEDTQNVLLHEMIHAEHFVKGIRDDDPTGHGSLFKAKMREINGGSVQDVFRPNGGYRVTVTHAMINEVRYYQKHHWACERCGDFVQRSMNRAPQKADCRMYRKGSEDVDCSDARCAWHVHQKYCGGVYVKIAGDDCTGSGDGKKKRAEKRAERRGKTALETWLGEAGQEKEIPLAEDRNEAENKQQNSMSSPVVIDLTACEVVDLT